MRIKKPHKKVNDDITFDTIEDRNKAVKTLIDGDLVKVLDASSDPTIESGWAVYRFCFETRTFDLVEKEIKEEVITGAPDTDGRTIKILHPDSSGLDKLAAPDLFRGMTQDVEILKDFDFDFTFRSDDWKQIKFTPRGGFKAGENSVRIPIKTKYGNKFLVLGRGTITVYQGDFDIGVQQAHWEIQAKIQDDDTDKYTTHGGAKYKSGLAINTYPQDGQYNYFPIMQIFAPIPSDGQPWDEKKMIVHKYWKHNLNVAPVKIPKLSLPTSSFSNIAERNRGKDSLIHGEIVKVTDASADPNVSKGWAWYRFSAGDSGSFSLVSKQFADLAETPTFKLPNQYFQDIATRNANQDSVADGEFVKVIDASAEKDIEVGYAWYRYTKQYKLWERVSTQFDNSRIVADIATRNTTSYTKNLKHGELVKVIDASADPNVSKGWAWYRYAKQSQLFDLVSKQYADQVEISAPKPDGITLEYAGYGDIANFTNEMTSVSNLPCMRPEFHILKDFDFDLEIIQGNTIKVTPRGLNGATRHIELSGAMGATSRVERYMEIRTSQFTIKEAYRGSAQFVQGFTMARLSPDYPSPMGMATRFGNGTCPTPRAIDDEEYVLLFVIKINTPKTGAFSMKDVTMYKLWKKHLAPFDELMDYRIANPE